MNTRKLLKNLIGLKNNLADQHKTELFKAKRHILSTALSLYHLKLEYEREMAEYGTLPVEYAESYKPLTEKEIDNIKEATEVRWQTGKQLGALKKRGRSSS